MIHPLSFASRSRKDVAWHYQASKPSSVQTYTTSCFRCCKQPPNISGAASGVASGGEVLGREEKGGVISSDYIAGCCRTENVTLPADVDDVDK